MKHSMKILAGVNVCVTALLMSTSAYAAYTPQNDWYLGLSGDATRISHYNVGGGGNVALGYQFSDFRLEAEAGYHALGDDGYGATHYITYMGNAYYDFNNLFPTSGSGLHIAPYIGAGLGDAAVSHGSSGFTNTFRRHDDSLAYDGMAGLTFTCASMPHTDMSVGYRYLGTDSHNLSASNLEAGLRFHF